MTVVADRIRARLKVLDLKPRAASLRAGRQPFAVRDILSGKNTNPKADLILDLSKALLCSTDYLLGKSDDPGLASVELGIDHQLVDVLQRIPASQQRMVRRMLEGVAEPSGVEFKTDAPKPGRAKTARSKKP